MRLIPLEAAVDLGNEYCGAKAMRLSVAQKLGIKVVPGFVISPDVLTEILEAPRAELKRLAASEDGLGHRRLRLAFEDAAHQIRWRVNAYQLIEAARMLRDISQGLIVRSSAVIEDGHRFSWAGIFESLFCVPTEEALAEAVRRVWASQWSYTAYLYRQRTRQIFKGDTMAVLIQVAINSTVGGVAFSCNPLNPSSGYRLVEATWGLPKAVVDASSAVDRYHFAPGGDHLTMEVNEKSVQLNLRDGQLTLQPVSSDAQIRPCLDRSDIVELDQILTRLENHFEGPQDVEWALVGDSLLLLQVRPQRLDSSYFFLQRGQGICFNPIDPL